MLTLEELATLTNCNLLKYTYYTYLYRHYKGTYKSYNDDISITYRLKLETFLFSLSNALRRVFDIDRKRHNTL